MFTTSTRILGIAAISVATIACSSRDELPGERRDSAPAAAVSAAEKTAPRPRIVVLGDSLTAGLGLAREDAYPALLQQRLNQEGLAYEVVNAGVSGDTSAGGLSRLDWALDGDVRVLVVALGANDGLRGLPPDELKRNLARIIERARARGAAVVLAGMEAPPNFGRQYTVEFHNVYPALAREYRVAFVPFLLDKVAGETRLNQRDGIHPTAEGARILADNVWAVLRPVLDSTDPRKAKSARD
jgi:acyl-CoA thioesterase I